MSRSLVLLLVMLSLVACRQSEAPAPSTSSREAMSAAGTGIEESGDATRSVAPLGSYRPLELQLGSALDGEGRVREARSTFATSDRVHLSVLGSAGDLPVRVKARWLDDEGRLLGESGQLLDPGPASVLTFSLTQPNGWPPGRYRVELALNDLEIDRREFEVH